MTLEEDVFGEPGDPLPIHRIILRPECEPQGEDSRLRTRHRFRDDANSVSECDQFRRRCRHYLSRIRYEPRGY